MYRTWLVGISAPQKSTLSDNMMDYLESKPPARFFVGKEWIYQTLKPFDSNFKPTAPGNRYWYGCLLGALGEEHIKDGCVLLDYGCGNAPLAVFLSGLLVDFEYYGVEPQGSPYIALSPKYPKIKTGFIDTSFEEEAWTQATCAVLGSVFTHLEWKDCCSILNKLKPIVERGGAIVFTCFLSNQEQYVGPNHYPHSKIPTYHYSFLTKEKMEIYAEEQSLRLELTEVFYSLGARGSQELVHRFVRLSKKNL